MFGGPSSLSLRRGVGRRTPSPEAQLPDPCPRPLRPRLSLAGAILTDPFSLPRRVLYVRSRGRRALIALSRSPHRRSRPTLDIFLCGVVDPRLWTRDTLVAERVAPAPSVAGRRDPYRPFFTVPRPVLYMRSRGRRALVALSRSPHRRSRPTLDIIFARRPATARRAAGRSSPPLRRSRPTQGVRLAAVGPSSRRVALRGDAARGLGHIAAAFVRDGRARLSPVRWATPRPRRSLGARGRSARAREPGPPD